MTFAIDLAESVLEMTAPADPGAVGLGLGLSVQNSGTLDKHVDILPPKAVGYLHACERPMTKKDLPVTRIEILQGTLDLIILQTLRWGPRHGYGIAHMIRAGSRDVLQVDTGSLYPALHRLERQGAVAADWEVSENSQRVRVYRLTAAGRKQLAAERSKWDQLAVAIAGLMVPPAESEP